MNIELKESALRTVIVLTQTAADIGIRLDWEPIRPLLYEPPRVLPVVTRDTIQKLETGFLMPGGGAVDAVSDVEDGQMILHEARFSQGTQSW